MSFAQGWHRAQARVRAELGQLLTIQPSERRWQMPLCAALASGLPLLMGAYFNHLALALVSSLGGLVFLYAPPTPLHHRMVTLMACAFGMCACYALGLISHFVPVLLVPVLGFTTVVVSMVCRFYRLGPPGSLFFIMAAAIGAYSPVEAPQLAEQVGLLTLGCLQACLIAFFYSLYIVRVQPPQAVQPLPPARFDFVVLDSVVIGLFVALSLALALLLQLDRPYWVPVSCLAVIQGGSLRAVWTRQFHRIAGTAIGLLLAWGLLQLPLDSWRVALLMTGLAFLIESLVVRHYGLAVVFITPLTLFIAEAAQLGAVSPDVLLRSRLLDTVLGCLMGLLGGGCLHHPRFRAWLDGPLRRLVPLKFMA